MCVDVCGRYVFRYVGSYEHECVREPRRGERIDACRSALDQFQRLDADRRRHDARLIEHLLEQFRRRVANPDWVLVYRRNRRIRELAHEFVVVNAENRHVAGYADPVCAAYLANLVCAHIVCAEDGDWFWQTAQPFEQPHGVGRLSEALVHHHGILEVLQRDPGRGIHAALEVVERKASDKAVAASVRIAAPVVAAEREVGEAVFYEVPRGHLSYDERVLVCGGESRDGLLGENVHHRLSDGGYGLGDSVVHDAGDEAVVLVPADVLAKFRELYELQRPVVPLARKAHDPLAQPAPIAPLSLYEDTDFLHCSIVAHGGQYTKNSVRVGCKKWYYNCNLYNWNPAMPSV